MKEFIELTIVCKDGNYRALFSIAKINHITGFQDGSLVCVDRPGMFAKRGNYAVKESFEEIMERLEDLTDRKWDKETGEIITGKRNRPQERERSRN